MNNPEQDSGMLQINQQLKPLELEWDVTLSNEFPWIEIAFDKFSPKECHKMYTSLVKSPEDFLMKILGNIPKYQRMLKAQLDSNDESE